MAGKDRPCFLGMVDSYLGVGNGRTIFILAPVGAFGDVE